MALSHPMMQDPCEHPSTHDIEHTKSLLFPLYLHRGKKEVSDGTEPPKPPAATTTARTQGSIRQRSRCCMPINDSQAR